MNVIGSRPNGWWRDRPGAMRALVDELARYARRTGDEVTVVFDGRPVDLDSAEGVGVRFACRRGRDAADDDIVELVARNAEPGSVEVATSDRALAARVRAARASVISVTELRARL
jgi:predicted RNA-binding protein with PIN domain